MLFRALKGRYTDRYQTCVSKNVLRLMRRFGFGPKEFTAVKDVKSAIERCISHNRKYYREVLGFFSKRLQCYLRGRANCLEDAEDLFIIVSLEAWQKLDRLREPEKIWPWVRRMAENRIKDYYKSGQGRTAKQETFDAERFIMDNRLETELIQKESAASVYRCISRLPQPYRQCAILYFLAENSPREIAVMLHTRLNTVKSHIYRARLLIRDRIGVQ